MYYKQHVVSMKMNRLKLCLVGACACALLLACSDDDSWTPANPNREKSSLQEDSSNSLKKSSSSSSEVEDEKLSSSSKVKSSSSEDVNSSSSFDTSPTCLVGGGFMWNGAAAEYRVNTGFDNGTETSGFWFSFGDNVDGGLSTITWPLPLGNDYSEEALDPVIDECSGVCGTFKLDAGTMDYDPFVGIAFNIAGTRSEYGDPLVDADVANACGWGGLCITYTVDVDAILELSMGREKDSALVGFDLPYAKLPKTVTDDHRCFQWSQFRQGGWGPRKITGDEIATTLAAIRFKIQGKDGTTGKFNVKTIGTY